jgi:hypothetical protein
MELCDPICCGTCRSHSLFVNETIEAELKHEEDLVGETSDCKDYHGKMR